MIVRKAIGIFDLKSVRALQPSLQFAGALTAAIVAQCGYPKYHLLEQINMISSGPVEDRLAIRELVESYNDAVMRFDAEAWGANWAEDGTWALPGRDAVVGKANIVPTWQQAMSAFSFVGFYASAGPIIVDGMKAHGTWYQQEFLDGKDGSKIELTGQYEDDYVKRGDRWYFFKRVYKVLKAG